MFVMAGPSFGVAIVVAFGALLVLTNTNPFLP